MLAAPSEDVLTSESTLDVTELDIVGMHCSACASRIERALRGAPGVASASVNLATNRAFVSFDPVVSSPDDLFASVRHAGYSATAVDHTELAASRGDDEHWVLRAAVSWPLAVAALSVSLAGSESARAGWSILTLAVLVEFIGGWPFLRNAARLLRHGATNMDTLISLGTLAALAVSAVEAVILGGAHVHVGSGAGAFAARLHGAMAPLIVSVLATGKAIEERSRRRASAALHSLLSLRPPTARVISDLDDDVGTLVAPETVPVDALVRVRPHESLPLDGVVVTGWSAVDESMLTGEPLPVDRGPDDAVTGGTRNGNGTLVLRTTSLASESVLARLQRLVDDAQRDKAPLQRVADRISAIFVPVVLALALATFVLWWLVAGEFGKAVLSAIAVLLVACPCAMGLAAPVAMMVGVGRASAMGIYVRNADALERLAHVDTVAFDKTGTLTERDARVVSVTPVGGVTEDELWEWAASIEKESDHPLARAIVAIAPRLRDATDVVVTPGVGVSGLVDGDRVTVSAVSRHVVPRELADAVAQCHGRGETVLGVDRSGAFAGFLALATPLRAEATSAIGHLRDEGLSSVILSGDSTPAVSTVGRLLGVDDARASLSPGDKLAALAGLRADGRTVLMVGDGVNDTPALAAADVGCAIGSGSEAALAESDVALLGNDLEGVPAAVGVARSTYAVILQNFGWAMGYNISALPLAAFGLLDPLIAAIAMGLSSILVVANSLRLSRLGRRGLAEVRGPQWSAGRRGIAVSIALPILLFAVVTVAGQAISPAKGQSLLPELPNISTFTFSDGNSVEVYLNSSQAGANTLHVFTTTPRVPSGPRAVVVTATQAGGEAAVVRSVREGVGHYANIVILRPGLWTFRVDLTVGSRVDTFRFQRTIS